MDNLDLWPGQGTIVQKTLDSLESKDSFFVNTSGTGAGKTIMITYAAYLAGYKLFVVVNASCRCVWVEMEKFVPILTILSYEKLRGPGKNKANVLVQPKHGYLRKEEIMNPNGTRSIRFFVTEKLLQLTQEHKVLLILDESHKTKNESLQSKAASVLVKHFRQHGKVGLLSATPFDHIRHISNLCRLLGIMQSRSLSTKGGTLTGLLEIRRFCELIDAKKTEKCIPDYVRSLIPRVARETCLHLWSKVIAPRHVFAMSQKAIFKEYGEKKNIKNLLCTIESKEFKQGMQELKAAVRWKDNIVQVDGQPQEAKKSYHFINAALMLLESAKVPTLIRLIKRDLFLHPYSKILVFCSFRDTIARLCKAFADWNPLRFEGQMSEKAAKRSKDLFQDPSLQYRLFFGNIAKGELGINLHDQHGERPRRMYLIPTYKNPHQAIGRVYRVGLRSNPMVRFVYGKEDTETRILETLAQMKPIMLETLPQQKKDKLIFPGEYPETHEPVVPQQVQQELGIHILFLFWITRNTCTSKKETCVQFVAAGYKIDSEKSAEEKKAKRLKKAKKLKQRIKRPEKLLYFYKNEEELFTYESLMALYLNTSKTLFSVSRVNLSDEKQKTVASKSKSWRDNIESRLKTITPVLNEKFAFGVDQIILEYYDFDLELYLDIGEV